MLLTVSLCHLLNDVVQSMLPAIYPVIKATYRLDFGQIGLITLTFNLTASLLQPVVGIYTDRRPTPYSLPVGMSFTMIGLVVLAFAPHFGVVLLGVALVGMGSSVFHPESSRLARHCIKAPCSAKGSPAAPAPWPWRCWEWFWFTLSSALRCARSPG